MMRRSSGAMVGFMVILALVNTAVAQVMDADLGGTGDQPTRTSPNSYEAIPVGPFLFSPAVQLNWQHRDNIFFTPDDPVADTVWMARARLQFELPLNESYILFAYTPQYRTYVDYELDDKWSHFVDVIGGFEFSNGLILDATYKYMQGNLETREVDPGGELYWGDRRYKKHFAGMQLSYWITARDGVNFEVDYTDLEHEDPDLWYNYTRLVAGAGWLHQLSEILVMNLAYRHTEFDPGANLYFENEFRKSASDELTVGFRGMLSPVIKTEIVVGYRETRYNVPPEVSSSVTDKGNVSVIVAVRVT